MFGASILDLKSFAAQAHADHLHVQSQQVQSHPVQVQAQVQAQSFQAKAKSLEKAAEAQTLQVRPFSVSALCGPAAVFYSLGRSLKLMATIVVQAQAVAHAQAQVEAHAQAQHLAAKAQVHAQARMEAASQADHLKNISCIGMPRGMCNTPDKYLDDLRSRDWRLDGEAAPSCFLGADDRQSRQVVQQTQQLEAQAQGHAQAQSQLVVHAHNLTAKAHAHANAQVSTKPFAVMLSDF